MKHVRWPFGRGGTVAIAAVTGALIVAGAVFVSARVGSGTPRELAGLAFNRQSPWQGPFAGGSSASPSAVSPSPSRQASPSPASSSGRPRSSPTGGTGRSTPSAAGGSPTPSAGSSPSSTPTGEGGGGGGGSSPSPTPTATPTSAPPPSGTFPRVGINVEPSIRPTRYTGANPNGWWCVGASGCYGVADGTAYVNAEMPLIASLGVQTLRIEFPWALIEPTRGGYDWSRADYIVNSANAHGVTLQPIIVFTPLWENVGYSGTPPAADLSAFVSALVARYSVKGVHFWEMWNEPDQSSYFSGSEAQYVSNVLVPGYQAAHAADAAARVILGAPSSANTGWLNAIYADGGGNSFDIMAYHDYASSGGVVIGDAGQVAGVLQSHGQSGKPIWLGEYGFQDNTISDTNQQALMTAVLTTSSVIAMAQWYNLRDDFSMTSPTTVYKSAYWGLATSSYALKNGYGTMQSLIRQGY